MKSTKVAQGFVINDYSGKTIRLKLKDNADSMVGRFMFYGTVSPVKATNTSSNEAFFRIDDNEDEYLKTEVHVFAKNIEDVEVLGSIER